MLEAVIMQTGWTGFLYDNGPCHERVKTSKLADSHQQHEVKVGETYF